MSHGYTKTTGNAASAVITGGESLAYSYNGPLLTSVAWKGLVTGAVSRVFDANLWTTSQSVDNAYPVALQRDGDGLLTRVGALLIARRTSDGLITRTTLGALTDAYGYDGAVVSYQAFYGSSLLYSDVYTRDADNRITKVVETIGGKTTTYGYSYDDAGRLTGVTQNGVVETTYVYDSNSNRVAATNGVTTLSGVYDTQDRLLMYGGNSYTYSANGALSSKTLGALTTRYQYDVSGNLLEATLASGKTLDHVVDPEDRRVGEKVNGELAVGYLYDGNRIVAQLTRPISGFARARRSRASLQRGLD